MLPQQHCCILFSRGSEFCPCRSAYTRIYVQFVYHNMHFQIPTPKVDCLEGQHEFGQKTSNVYISTSLLYIKCQNPFIVVSYWLKEDHVKVTKFNCRPHEVCEGIKSFNAHVLTPGGDKTGSHVLLLSFSFCFFNV